MTNKNIIFNQKGYIALITVLIILAVSIVIGVTVSMNAINEMQLSFTSMQAEQAFSLADACTEEGILRLKRGEQPPATIAFDDNSCTIAVVDTDGNSCESGDTCYLQVTGTVDNYNSLIEVELVTGDDFAVLSWQQVSNHTNFE